MPNCFQLCRKTAPTVPVVFTAIDEEMCAALGVRVDANSYHMGWYGIIGMNLACGQSFAKQLQDCRDVVAADPDDTYWPRMLRVLTWLDAHFVSNAWSEIGRR